MEERHARELRTLTAEHAIATARAVSAAEESARKAAALEQTIAVTAAVEREREACKGKAMDDVAALRQDTEVSLWRTCLFYRKSIQPCQCFLGSDLWIAVLVWDQAGNHRVSCRRGFFLLF